MSENLSIYNRIKEALLPDGTLPEDFVLRQMPEQGLRFADGAIDGTVRYHMGPTKNPDISALTLVLEMASQERFKDSANALITHFQNGGVMLPVMDALQDWVFDHPEKLSPEALGRFCMTLLVQSEDVESVKFAITILELLDREETQELKDILLVLAASEELTLFCLFLLSSFEDGNALIYSVAKRLKGWGRIHAVSMLKPENDEMAQWLLNEGWRNEIMPEYSAIVAIKRGGLLDRLVGDNATKEDFQLAGELIGASLEDNPVPGLNKYKKSNELLGAYLKLADKYAEDLEDYSNIFDIRDFLEKGELAEKGNLLKSADSILESEECIDCVEASMDGGDGFYLGKALGLDYAARAMDTLRHEWQTKYDIIDLLLPEKQYVDEIIELFEDELPLEDMASGPENEMGNDERFADYGILSYVIQGLQSVPGKGERLICAGLYSPVIGTRNIALNTVDKWRKSDFQLTTTMENTLMKLKSSEVNEQTKKRLEKF
ncbi:hypothetical protein NZ47_00400 [Anaerovibrio lipolyticus]|uniref:Limonene hydroxylase n=1 Tax=Anaerovibrio lipolyticus TaxID=82374 RepID=A0A0B2JY09_9FIRM|nr:hypothetical protein [Anaerovibrio lipolyticus]KHM53180.1 hypothetical protein NZ47_00400 [Anaerovibrio lipolyticus]